MKKFMTKKRRTKQDRMKKIIRKNKLLTLMTKTALSWVGQKSSCTQYASLPTVHTLPYILWVTQIKQNNNGFYLL